MPVQHSIGIFFGLMANPANSIDNVPGLLSLHFSGGL